MASNRFPVSLVKGSVLTPDSGPPWDLRMGLSVVMTEGIGLAAVSWFKDVECLGRYNRSFPQLWSLFFESRMFAALVMLWLVISQENLLGCPTSRQNLLEQARGSTGANVRWKPPPLGTGSCQMEKMDIGCMLLGRLVIYPVQNTRSVSYVCIYDYIMYIYNMFMNVLIIKIL